MSRLVISLLLLALTDQPLALSASWNAFFEDNIDRIDSVRYVQTKTLVLGKTPDLIWSKKTITDCSELYDLDYLGYDKDGSQVTEHRECLTENYFMVLHVRSAFLHLFKAAPKSHTLMANESFLYSVYEFLLKDSDRAKYFDLLRIRNLKVAWNRFKHDEKATPLESRDTFFGDNLNVFSVAAGLHPKYKIASEYRVFYSIETGEIIGWHLIVKKGMHDVIVTSLHVNDATTVDSKNGPIWYPREFKKHFYGGSLDAMKNKPTHYLNYRTLEAEFNQVDKDDIGFDPSVARVIRDEEAKKNVFVPQ
jgi:hypothetical protein